MTIAASLVIILAGVKTASGLLGPILLALFIAIVLLIPLRFLQRYIGSVLLPYLIVIGGTIVLFLTLTYFVSTSLNEFIGKIPAYKDRFSEKLSSVEKLFEKFGFELGKPESKTLTPADSSGIASVESDPKQPPMPENKPSPPVQEPVKEESPPAKSDSVETAAKTAAEIPEDEKGEKDKKDETEDEDKPATVLGLPLHSTLNEAELPIQTPEQVEQWVRDVSDEKKQSLIALDRQSVIVWVTNLFLQLRHLIEGGFLVLIFSIFFLLEASQFSLKVNKAFGKNGAINNSHFHQIAQDVRHYLVLKSIVNVASGGAAMFVYWLFGIPAWFFWGIMAFFLYYIPNIGGTLAAVIPGVLIFVNYDLPGLFLYAMCLVAIECTIAYGFEPRFLGHGLGLSTVVILLTLVFWGWILGPIGLFLAAPLTVMIKIVLQAFPETKWIAILLDDNRSVKR